jgi:hypothetical protein
MKHRYQQAGIVVLQSWMASATAHSHVWVKRDLFEQWRRE